MSDTDKKKKIDPPEAETAVEPEREKSIEPDPERHEDEPPCPDGYPPADWAAKSAGDKRTYLAVLDRRKSINGDEK